jgi:hypothetical protein
MHREIRIEDVSKVDAVGFRHKPEQVRVRVKRPRQAAVANVEPFLVFPI